MLVIQGFEIFSLSSLPLNFLFQIINFVFKFELNLKKLDVDLGLDLELNIGLELFHFIIVGHLELVEHGVVLFKFFINPYFLLYKYLGLLMALHPGLR
jgi:hypothetical protein